MYIQQPNFTQAISGIAFHAFFKKISKTEKANLTTLEKLPEEMDPLPLLFAKQMHSNNVIVLEELWTLNNQPKGDAIVTNKTNIAISIYTADCVPIIFIDPFFSVIGIAHCGWKGLNSNVIGATVKSMQKIGAVTQNIICCIGPCIRKASYEVGTDVYDAVIAVDKSYSAAFTKRSKIKDKFLFNLPKCATQQLMEHDIKHIYDCKIDTYKRFEEFSSYRKSCHNNVDLTHYNISTISLLTDDHWERLCNIFKRESKKKQLLYNTYTSQPKNVSNGLSKIVGITQKTLEPELDLHGLTIDDAYNQLEQFITEHHNNGKRLLLVITGKGRKTTSIQNEIPNWLTKSNLSKYISHFTHAETRHGGKGALYVFLKKNPHKEPAL